MPSLPRRRWIGTRSSVVATISDGGANPAHRPFRRLPPVILKPPLHCPQTRLLPCLPSPIHPPPSMPMRSTRWAVGQAWRKVEGPGASWKPLES